MLVIIVNNVETLTKLNIAKLTLTVLALTAGSAYTAESVIG